MATVASVERKVKRLTPSMRAVLDRGSSEKMSHLALSAANAGWSIEDLVQAAARSRADERALRRAWPSAERLAGARREVLVETDRLRAWLEAAALPSRTGTMTQLVCDAHLMCRAKAGSRLYWASLREIAEVHGASLHTVIRAQTAMKMSGVLTLVLSGAGTTRASWWTLAPIDDPAWARCLGTDEPASPAPAPASEAGHGWRVMQVCPDAFRSRRGLSKGAFLLRERLTHGPATEGQLAGARRRCRRTIRRQLARLEAVGLAVRDGDRWLAGMADLEQVAAMLGTIGTAARQRWRHRQEREAYRLIFAARCVRDARWERRDWFWKGRMPCVDATWRAAA